MEKLLRLMSSAKRNSGIDLLLGGNGNDTLTGGPGADVFDCNGSSASPVGGSDTITGFVNLADKIDLSSIDAVTGGVNNAFAPVAAFTHKAGQLTITANRTTTFVSGDVNGDAVADFQIQINGLPGVTSADIIL